MIAAADDMGLVAVLSVLYWAALFAIGYVTDRHPRRRRRRR